MIKIRPFEKAGWAATWQILEPVFRASETYAFSPDITEQDAPNVWVDMPSATFVAPALGAHVCNCGYVVAENARGKGVGSEMCEHSQREAVSQGFRAMQYNLVVSTNDGAVRLWKRHGFQVVGTLPKAFRHQQLGFVDAYIMYKQLKT